MISEEKKKKIREDILSLLFENSPKAMFTSEIAQFIARDEEFVLKLLEDLNSQNLVRKVDKSENGRKYLARKRWNLTSKTYDAYKTILDNKT